MMIGKTTVNKISKVMGFVRCFAKKYGNIGILDYYNGELTPLCLSISDKDLYVPIENSLGTYDLNRIIPLTGITAKGKDSYFCGNKIYFTPNITLDVERNGAATYYKNIKSIILNIRKPVLLLEYLNGVKCAYGISEYGNNVKFVLDLETSTIDDFKKCLDKIEEQKVFNQKEFYRYELLKKKRDVILRKISLNSDFGW